MMNDASCDTKKCCMKPWLISAFIAFLVTLGYDWYVHSKLLMDMYTATAAMWRKPEEMQALQNLCLAKHALMALIFSGAYLCWRSKTVMGAVGSPDCPYKKSMGFGLWVGLLLGINMASAYIYMPIPQNLAWAWLIAETAKWTLTGAVLSYFTGSCGSSSTTCTK